MADACAGALAALNRARYPFILGVSYAIVFGIGMNDVRWNVFISGLLCEWFGWRICQRT